MRTRGSKKCEERDGDSLNLMDQFGDPNSPLQVVRVTETTTVEIINYLFPVKKGFAKAS